MEWHIIPTGRVWVDRGGPFGLVPQSLWDELEPPNERQRTPMDLNSLLVFSEGKTILVDSGLGHKLPPKGVRNWGLEWPEGTLVENLAAHGVAPEDVDIVIDTHLHADHCGGNTRLEGEQVVPTFPNAVYMVQQVEFADAYHPDARTRSTYLADNFVPIWQQGRFQFLLGDSRVTEHVRTVVARGHTRAMQCVILEEEGKPPILFTTDLSSYAVHFTRTAWVTAYDVEPLETIQTKQRWQTWALETNALLIFQHDTHTRAACLFQDDQGRYQLDRVEPGSIG